MSSKLEEQGNTLFEIPSHLIALQKDNIYTTTATHFNEFYTAYKRFPLPNNVFFPWLHGVDGNNNQQNLFFGVRRTLVPNYRGIMLIHCSDFEQTARLMDSVMLDQIISTEPLAFTQNKEATINLRNFQNQISRFATLCDLVLYGPKATEIASLVSKAQKDLYEERTTLLDNIQRTAGKRATINANRIIYKTIIIEDDFSIFEKEFPDYVMSDSNGVSINKRNFLELEGNYMRSMSQASEITDHVWMGNTADVPFSTLESTEEENPNPNQFSICIETHDLAEMPLPSTLTLARELLNDLPDGETPPEIIHFDAYGSSVPSNDHDEFKEFSSRLLLLLNFIQDQVKHRRHILIHCSDGYTETSLLGLAWIMFNQHLSLPEAYLYLQERRSFFVYAADVPTLRRIESVVLNGTIEPDLKRKKCMGKQVKSKTEDHRILHEDGYINQISNSTQDNIYRQLYLSPTPEEELSYPWFFSPRFEGSFPSRMLPFLYLGNLNHATNTEMLKALKITHVVSVGEKADLDQTVFKVLDLDNLYDDGIDSIKARLDKAIAFVESARLEKTQCLIHCRVGVSRSAALTICYIMKHMNYTLVDAYLYVRARRLNVIIQPNLKFMYEMLQLEHELKGSISITWPILCEEVYNLNFSYRDVVYP